MFGKIQLHVTTRTEIKGIMTVPAPHSFLSPSTLREDAQEVFILLALAHLGNRDERMLGLHEIVL